MDWNIHEIRKHWVSLENPFTQFPIHTLPWILPRHWLWEILPHPLIQTSLVAFTQAAKSKAFSASMGSLTTLKVSPVSPPGNTSLFLGREWPHKDVLAHYFFLKDNPRSYENLTIMSLTNYFPFWTYRQIQHLFSAQASTATWTTYTIQILMYTNIATKTPNILHICLASRRFSCDPGHIMRDKDLQISFSDDE